MNYGQRFVTLDSTEVAHELQVDNCPSLLPPGGQGHPPPANTATLAVGWRWGTLGISVAATKREEDYGPFPGIPSGLS